MVWQQKYGDYSMNSIKIMIFLWHLGVVDSLTLFQFFMNCGAQYGGVVVAEAAGSMNDIGPSVLLAPLAGLRTSYKYVQAAQGAMEKKDQGLLLLPLLWQCPAEQHSQIQ